MTAARSEGFDDARAFWDGRFSSPDYIFGKAPNVFLTEQRHLFAPGMRVLDVASGEGRNAVWLAQQGCDVVGIDVSPLALDKARRLASEHGVSVDFQTADVRQWQWPHDAFDAVITIFIQFAAPHEREALFDVIKASLHVGGIFVLQGYTPKQIEFATGGPPRADHMYTAALLREAFSDFDILHLREHEAVLSEGTKHVGRSALVDLVVRKRADSQSSTPRSPGSSYL